MSLIGRMRLKNVLVITQISLSLLLLVCAALFVRSWQNAEELNPGFNPENMLAMDISLSEQGFTEEQGLALFRAVVATREIFTWMLFRWLSRIWLQSISQQQERRLALLDHPPPAGQNALLISSNRISPGYFQATQMQLIRGREFTEQDDANAIAWSHHQ